jgi:hypothetical protein
MTWLCYINDDRDVVAMNLSKVESITLNRDNTKVFIWFSRDDPVTGIPVKGAVWCEESMLLDKMQTLRKKANETPLG